MFYEPASRDTALLPHDPFKAIIAPRPVGWISAVDQKGAVNLSPYSFFNAFHSRPNIVAFGSEGVKDAAAFAMETKEFVFNLATYALRDKMNMTSAPLPRGQSEFAFAGLTPAPSRIVKAPRVKESPVALECMVTDVMQLKGRNGQPLNGIVIFGEVVGVHIDDAFVKDGRFDTAGAQPIARCGYADYAVVTELFSIERPPGG